MRPIVLGIIVGLCLSILSFLGPAMAEDEESLLIEPAVQHILTNGEKEEMTREFDGRAIKAAPTVDLAALRYRIFNRASTGAFSVQYPVTGDGSASFSLRRHGAFQIKGDLNMISHRFTAPTAAWVSNGIPSFLGAMILSTGDSQAAPKLQRQIVELQGKSETAFWPKADLRVTYRSDHKTGTRYVQFPGTLVSLPLRPAASVRPVDQTITDLEIGLHGGGSSWGWSAAYSEMRFMNQIAQLSVPGYAPPAEASTQNDLRTRRASFLFQKEFSQKWTLEGSARKEGRLHASGGGAGQTDSYRIGFTTLLSPTFLVSGNFRALSERVSRQEQISREKRWGDLRMVYRPRNTFTFYGDVRLETIQRTNALLHTRAYTDPAGNPDGVVNGPVGSTENQKYNIGWKWHPGKNWEQRGAFETRSGNGSYLRGSLARERSLWLEAQWAPEEAFKSLRFRYENSGGESSDSTFSEKLEAFRATWSVSQDPLAWKADTQLGGKKPFKDFMIQVDLEKGNRSSDMYWGYWSPAANQTNERGVSHPYRQDSVFLRRSWQWPKGQAISLEGQWTDTQADIPAVSAGGFPPPPATVTSLSPMRQTVLRAGVEFRLKAGERTEWRLKPSVVSYKDHVNSSLTGQFPLLEASLVTRF